MRPLAPPARAAALLIILAVAGCTAAPSRSPHRTSLASQTPVAIADPSASPILGSPASPATLREHGILSRAQASLAVTTDGRGIFFSGAPFEVSAPDHGPNLYRATPGDEPVLLWASPRRGSDLLPVAGWGDYAVFAEVNAELFGEAAWILWLLTPGSADPVELDRNPPRNGAALPQVAINEGHVVWAVTAGGPEVVRSELIEVALPSLDRRVLRSDDPAALQWFHPALDGDRVVYTEVDYVHGDPASLAHPAELYAMLLDLSDPAAEPVRLDTSGRATEPAIAGDTVVWKEADNVFTWGSLTRHSLASGETRPLVTSPQGGVKTPTVGNRYVAFWGIDDTEFFVYDLKRDEVVPIFQLAPDSPIGGAFRPEVAGDLLVWVQGTEGLPVIGWGRLPTTEDP